MMESYFDHEVGGVLLLDPERLTLGDPDHPSLPRVTSDGWTLRQRIELARADLKQLLAGWVPSGDDLANAPVLVDWRSLADRGGPVLRGRVFGHPGITDGHRVMTSGVIAFDAAGKRWVRTVSRFYTLGARDALRRI